MNILKNFKKNSYIGFSPILIIIIIGAVMIGGGYYLFTYTDIFENKNNQINNSFKVLNDINRHDDSMVPPGLDTVIELALQEGETGKIQGTDIFITAEKVDDLIGRPCVEGPFGCANRASIEVSRQLVTKDLELFSPKSIGIIEEKKHQAVAFGYRITLVDLQNKKITLRFEVFE
jgi:hypothetical protein